MKKIGTTSALPTVSIITVNYNQSSVTFDLLESLRKITYPNTEIIVVDNASPNDVPDSIKDKYPEITLLKSKENLGFAGGNNLGIEKSTGEYLLFINNDTEVPADFLEPLVGFYQSHPDAGMISPKIRYHHTPEMIQYAGYTEINLYTIRNHSIGYKEIDENQYNENRVTAFGHGAAMMVSRKVIEKVGMMPDIYFLYYEELDWGWKIRKEGFINYYVGNSVIFHKESISTGKNSPMKTYYMARNRILFTRRNSTGIQKWISIIYQIGIAGTKNMLLYLIRGETKHFFSYWSGLSWHFRNLRKNNIRKTPQLIHTKP
ncbi:MAG TPA: glycosyltransferase family 2 protein [Prolixibacteraceae bacterium]|nr:glycosyltransferase family 2 protein [Prolixibacteraceae bacterium]